MNYTIVQPYINSDWPFHASHRKLLSHFRGLIFENPTGQINIGFLRLMSRQARK